MTAYQAHKRRWGQCTACPLWKTRKHVVLARGVVPADILFCGEAPGDSEDVLAQPFIGPAGHLLDRIVRIAIPANLGFRLAYTNLVACIPVKTKDSHEPTRLSMDKCRPRLVEFVAEVAQPRLLVLVGKLAKSEIVGQADFGECEWLRGKWLGFCDIVHPSAILQAKEAERGPMIKRAVVVLEQAVGDLVGRRGRR
jgi:uracil-DNA glycosylase family 4